MSGHTIDFSQYEQSAPAQIDFSKYEKPQTAKPDRFAQDTATTEAWAQNHPILGPIARFLVSGGQNAANAITGTPGQLYHAIIDPPTDEEAALSPEQRFAFRLGGKQAIEAGEDYASGKVTPSGAASVLPEALGTGVGQVAGGAVYGKTGEIAGKVLPMATEAATRALESPGGQAAKAALSAAAKKLPAAAVKRIPYVGPVLSDIYKAGSEAAAEARAAAEPEAAASAEPAATVEEPAQPLPKPKAKTVKQSTALGPNAQVQNQAEALGPRTIVTDPATGRPEFSDVVEAKQQSAAPVETKPAPVETKAAPAETPAAQPAPKPVGAAGPAADDLLERLKGIADRIQKQETAAPGSADEDLVQQAQDSLDMVRARKAAGITRQPETPAETQEEFKQRLSAIADRKAAQAAGKTQSGASGDLRSIFNRLVKGEAGQAGAPGSVTDADEGIAAAPDRANAQGGIDEIRNQPVIGKLTKQVPARGYLKMVGADENSVLKTQGDLDSVFYHRQQIAKTGQAPSVELHLDEGNNVIGTDGRHRAIAAIQQGGTKANVNVTVYKHPYQNPR